jgi:hypothetical protein
MDLMNPLYAFVWKSRTAKPVDVASMLGKVELCASGRLKREDRYRDRLTEITTFLDDNHGLVIEMDRRAMEYCGL